MTDQVKNILIRKGVETLAGVFSCYLFSKVITDRFHIGDQRNQATGVVDIQEDEIDDDE